MKAIIEPSYLHGTINPPPSKSITQRVLAAALLHKGTTIVHNTGTSADDKAALNIIQQLGAQVTELPGGVISITSTGAVNSAGHIDCGESGLSARLFTPIAALCSDPITIQGQGSLLQRPMDSFATILSQVGITIDNFNGHLPFTINGPLQPAYVKIDASGGSQFLTGLLFALSYAAKAPLTIEVTGLKSQPYIDVTLDVLKNFGREITHDNYSTFYIDPAKYSFRDIVEITVEADWSSAAFFLVAGAIAGNVTVNNLHPGSLQADRVIMDVLRHVGAEIEVAGNAIISKKTRLRSFDFDATHCPDLFPILAVIAAYANGESCIKGIHRLFHKESNRVESITDMLFDLGIEWSVEDDCLFVTGEHRSRGAIINSFHDHRIAMAASIAALRASGPVAIQYADAVSKSYPAFFDDLVLLGGKCILA